MQNGDEALTSIILAGRGLLVKMLKIKRKKAKNQESIQSSLIARPLHDPGTGYWLIYVHDG